MQGNVFRFPLIIRCSNEKIISGVRSKYPISFFQLIPQEQCFSPMNCCFIFRPQEDKFVDAYSYKSFLFYYRIYILKLRGISLKNEKVFLE